MAIQRLVRQIPVPDKVVEAILKLVRSAVPAPAPMPRPTSFVAWGPGPRASQALMLAVRAKALIDGRLAPSVDDVIGARRAGPEAPHGAVVRGTRRRRRICRHHRPPRGSGGVSGTMAGPPGRPIGSDRRTAARARRSNARRVSLVDRMPELLMEADRIAATVAHGIHGRRRAGPGETFWQFRQYQSGEGAQLIDWRRSAGSDHLFVREREWEAAHTIYLWPNLSPSMRFKSHLSQISKRDRALVLTLAAAELLVRGGERVALLGVTQPTASRRATQHLPKRIVTDARRRAAKSRCRRRRVLGTLLERHPVSRLPRSHRQGRERIEGLGAAGATGHLVQVLDPAEETLPYQGRTEFLSPDGTRTLGRRPRREVCAAAT